ncbi:hypothetical protein GF420_03560 [candidate division GN15 bacterium]|nr:hypothetical protein [candidate division GN15 bacterium]
MNAHTPSHRFRRAIGLMLIGLLMFTAAAFGADPARYAVTDLRVCYLYDDPATIDWPTLYYLNDNFGCRIDLVRLIEGGGLYEYRTAIEEKGLFRHDYHLPSSGEVGVDSVLSLAFAERHPDLVIVGTATPRPITTQARDRLMATTTDHGSLFHIRKIYQLAGSDSTATDMVVLTSRGLFKQYSQRIITEVPQLFEGYSPGTYDPPQMTRYTPLYTDTSLDRSQPGMLDGLDRIRLGKAIDSLLGEGKIREALGNRARNFIALYTLAQNVVGRKRVESIVQGYKEIVQLEYQCASQRSLMDNAEFLAYLARLVERARVATMDEIGMDWDGRIVIRESPHGPKVKFTARLAVNGPKEIELSYIKFDPYWDDEMVVLDSVSRKIQPHQTYMKEFLVDIDPQYLESTRPESLSFAAEIVYSRIPLTVTSSLPLAETPALAVSFEPDFFFVEPSARVNVDRVVSAMRWKVRIDKPRAYSGQVRLELKTPRGVFAGAYRQDVTLESGRENEVIEIPFSVSNLFEMGIHEQTVELRHDNRLVSADTGQIRIASCEIPDTLTVAFLADTTGQLEDVLRIAGAGFQPLTDRSLWTAFLDAYSVIVIGSGAHEQYPSLKKSKSRLEEYVRNGGSLVIMGQPYTWPENVLPVSLTPERETVTRAEITNRIAGANVLSRPYRIKLAELFAEMTAPTAVSSAVISPSERVLVTPSGATLLSVSRLGEGQIIYCGLPLLDMVAELNLEAIHLFANLLNY